MTDKICGNCKWHCYEEESQDWVCCNADSDYVADWCDYDHTCDDWEERESGGMRE